MMFLDSQVFSIECPLFLEILLGSRKLDKNVEF